jgi:hypothetical protein
MTVSSPFSDLLLLVIDHASLNVDSLLYIKVLSHHRDHLHAFLLEDGHELLNVLSFLLLVPDLIGHEDAVEIQILRDKSVALDRLVDALRKHYVLRRDGDLVKVGGTLAIAAESRKFTW